MGILLKFSRLIDALNRLVGRTIIWLILAATLISAANAVARKAFNFSSNAYLEIQWYLYAAVFLLGAGVTFLQNAHVRIDVVANRLPARARMYLDIGGIVLFLLPLCFFMILFAWPIVARAWVTGEISSNAGGLIRWPVYALVPAGFALLALQGVSELIKRIGFLSGKAPNPLLAGLPDDGNGPGCGNIPPESPVETAIVADIGTAASETPRNSPGPDETPEHDGPGGTRP